MNNKQAGDFGENEIVEFVNKIQTAKGDQSIIGDYQKQIDQLVYKLYSLTPEEIAVVEGK